MQKLKDHNLHTNSSKLKCNYSNSFISTNFSSYDSYKILYILYIRNLSSIVVQLDVGYKCYNLVFLIPNHQLCHMIFIFITSQQFYHIPLCKPKLHLDQWIYFQQIKELEPIQKLWCKLSSQTRTKKWRFHISSLMIKLMKLDIFIFEILLIEPYLHTFGLEMCHYQNLSIKTCIFKNLASSLFLTIEFI